MPDFDVNEGYLHASARRADPSLPGGALSDGISVDGRVAPYGLDVTSEQMFEAMLEDGADEPVDDGSDPAREALVYGEPTFFEPPHRLPEQTPIVRRTRHDLIGHHTVRDAGSGRRVGVAMVARRRRLARRACPCGWTVRVLSTPPRRRRRLWTSCHGHPRQTPGSLS
ncbi:MAG TPA: hypothetical protein VMG80_04160 [Solirubrobacteraceae bacterium]|nr:hypothetical protein [Solirubrobacteraceae bacterium]